MGLAKVELCWIFCPFVGRGSPLKENEEPSCDSMMPPRQRGRSRRVGGGGSQPSQHGVKLFSHDSMVTYFNVISPDNHQEIREMEIKLGEERQSLSNSELLVGIKPWPHEGKAQAIPELSGATLANENASRVGSERQVDGKV